MDRPRIAAIVSGAAASVVAFSVVSHWRLVGTLAGAALVPVIYTLVSHWSSAGLDGAGRWARRRLGRGASPQRPATAGGPVEAAVPGRGRRPGGLHPQWLLGGSALLALAVSIYTLAAVPPDETGDKVVVQRVVVEKTVTVTTGAEGPAPGTAGADIPEGDNGVQDVSADDGPMTLPAEIDDADSTVPATDGAEEGVPEGDISPPTTSVVGQDDGATLSTTSTTEPNVQPGDAGGDPSSQPGTSPSTSSAQ